MSAKYRPAFLILFVLLSALTLPGCTFGQQTAEAFVTRGKGEMDKGDWDGAIADFTKAIEHNPKDDAAFVNRGVAKANKGDLDGAIVDYSRAIELQQEFDASDGNRGNVKKAKGDQVGAGEDLAQAAKRREQDAKIFVNRGIAKANKGDWDGGIAAYTKAIELNPKDAEAYPLLRGRANKNAGGLAQLLADLTNPFMGKTILSGQDHIPGGREFVFQLLAGRQGEFTGSGRALVPQHPALPQELHNVVCLAVPCRYASWSERSSSLRPTTT